MTLMLKHPPKPFRVRTYCVSKGKIKYQDQPCATIQEARKAWAGTKLGVKCPGTITFRSTQADVEQFIKQHWTLLMRRNSKGRFVVEGQHIS